eukprot:scaffold7029_cov375-Pinguiococcus_pyrenoidosus.AAC.8
MSFQVTIRRRRVSQQPGGLGAALFCRCRLPAPCTSMANTLAASAGPRGVVASLLATEGPSVQPPRRRTLEDPSRALRCQARPASCCPASEAKGTRGFTRGETGGEASRRPSKGAVWRCLSHVANEVTRERNFLLDLRRYVVVVKLVLTASCITAFFVHHARKRGKAGLANGRGHLGAGGEVEAPHWHKLGATGFPRETDDTIWVCYWGAVLAGSRCSSLSKGCSTIGRTGRILTAWSNSRGASGANAAV